MHDGGDLIERRRSLFQGGGLLFGALREVVAGVAQLVGVGVDRTGRLAHFAHGALEGRKGSVDVLLQFGEGALEFAAHGLGQIAIRGGLL